MSQDVSIKISSPLTADGYSSIDPEERISELCSLLETYLEPESVNTVYHAYKFAARAHEGQRRISGEPYINHPVAVAKILAEMHMDPESIIAAILHDTIEDTPTVKEQIVKEFGQDVADIVDGVSKLTQMSFETKAMAQAENFRKMVLAMAQDIRVILIKLADRLHNMRTLGVMPPRKRRRIARETLEIHAPIANRLGINTIRVELEDLGFESLYPLRARVLRDRIKKAKGHRKEIITKILDTVATRLEQENIPAMVAGREKHIYSLYRKMLRKALSFPEVLDVFAFRLVVKSVDDAYRSLGVVHSLYKPVPGKFKDYIAIPKANGYQSLHTVLFGPKGVPIEIQIRTEDMDRVAEAGIAAHWLYKEGNEPGNRAQARAREWVRGLLEMQQSAGNSLEFIENVKVDLFPDEIYVFTPQGEIMELPRGATPIDFAYAVHSDIGDACLAAKVNRRLVPLRTPLETGQTVEIISAPGAKPNAAWLDFVKTAKARSAIRHYLKKLKQEDALQLGRRLVTKALHAINLDFDEVSPDQLVHVVQSFGVTDIDQLFEEVGLGKRMPAMVAQRFRGAAREPGDNDLTMNAGEPLTITGKEGSVVTYGKCCKPIPGDSVVGFVSSGRGVVVHRRGCKNVADFRKNPEKWIDVQWGSGIDRDFSCAIRLDVTNQRGVLASLAATISDAQANIENVQLDEKDGLVSMIQFVITVRDRIHLAKLMKRLRVLQTVMRISRIRS